MINLQATTTFLFVASLVSSAFASPVPDCPPGGHIHSASYAYPAPSVQLSVDKSIESVSVAPLAYTSYNAAPSITYAKSAGVVFADKSPAATYAGIVPSGKL